MYLEHANIQVRSLEHAKHFLLTAFPQFKIRGGSYNPSYGHWIHIGSDNSYFCFHEPDNKSAATKQEGVGPKQGFSMGHLGCVTTELDAVIGRLEAAGYHPDVSELDSHPHRRRIYFQDNNGIEWEFIEYLSDDPRLRNDYDL